MRLDDWMNQASMTDEKLAGLLDVDRTTITRIRRGTRRPSMRLAEAISRATDFAVRLDDFSVIPALSGEAA